MSAEAEAQHPSPLDSGQWNEADVGRLHEARNRILDQLGKIIVGQEAVIDEIMICLFSRGHCMLEGVPGLAKTLMISTLAETLDLSFSRVQFTPDLMPADVTGTEIIEEDRATGHREMRFMEGPLFANVVLADEINRTPPKTQAALLEAMQERQVTVGRVRHPLDDPFFVLATQNPIEQEGTYPLPEAQQDRFMFKVFVEYPSFDEEFEVARRTTGSASMDVEPVLGADEILRLQQLVRQVPVSDHVVRVHVIVSPPDPRRHRRRARLRHRPGGLGRRPPGGPVLDPRGQSSGAAAGAVPRPGRGHSGPRRAGAPSPHGRQLCRRK